MSKKKVKGTTSEKSTLTVKLPRGTDLDDYDVLVVEHEGGTDEFEVHDEVEEEDETDEGEEGEDEEDDEGDE